MVGVSSSLKGSGDLPTGGVDGVLVVCSFDRVRGYKDRVVLSIGIPMVSGEYRSMVSVPNSVHALHVHRTAPLNMASVCFDFRVKCLMLHN